MTVRRQDRTSRYWKKHSFETSSDTSVSKNKNTLRSIEVEN